MISIKKYVPLAAIISVLLIFLIASPLFSEENSHTSSTAADTEITGTRSSEAEGHSEGHSTDRSADLIDLGYRFMSFTVLIIVLVVVFRKVKILDYFSTRSEEIKKKLEDLKRDKDEAERKYKEIEEQLKNFEAKRNDIIEQYRREGVNEKDRIISEAKERVKQIIAQSEITIEQEIESARNQLKHDIMDIASKRAQDILVKELDEKDQENMVVEFVEKVGKVN